MVYKIVVAFRTYDILLDTLQKRLRRKYRQLAVLGTTMRKIDYPGILTLMSWNTAGATPPRLAMS